MNKLLLLSVALLVGGCRKTEQPINTDEDETQKQTPAKELTEEEKKVVGAYEEESTGFNYKIVFLENGLAETYLDGRKVDDGTKWSIVNGEIYLGALDDADVGNAIGVYRINKDRSITNVAMIRPNGRREDLRKVNHHPLKKIK